MKARETGHLFEHEAGFEFRQPEILAFKSFVGADFESWGIVGFSLSEVPINANSALLELNVLDAAVDAESVPIPISARASYRAFDCLTDLTDEVLANGENGLVFPPSEDLGELVPPASGGTLTLEIGKLLNSPRDDYNNLCFTIASDSISGIEFGGNGAPSELQPRLLVVPAPSSSSFLILALPWLYLFRRKPDTCP